MHASHLPSRVKRLTCQYPIPSLQPYADGVKQITVYEDEMLKLNDNKSKLINTYLGEDEDERDCVGITGMQNTT